MESPSGDFSNFSECPKSNTTTKLLRRSSSSSIHDSDQLKPPQVVRISVSDPNATDSSSNEEEEKETEFTPFRQRRRTVKKFISEITVVEVSSSSCSGAAGSSWEEEVQRISPSRRPWEAYLASAQTIANNGISKKSDWNVGGQSVSEFIRCGCFVRSPEEENIPDQTRRASIHCGVESMGKEIKSNCRPGKAGCILEHVLFPIVILL
ncbi:hypothetical protein LINGRAHAP2_LOCUS26261 [Linum grandiflorum]